MSTVAKVFVVLNFLLAAVFLGSAASLLGHSDNWKRRYDETKVTLEAQRDEQRALANERQRQIDTLQQDKSQAEKARTDAQARADAFKTAFDTLREKYDALVTDHGSIARALQIAQNTIQNGRTLVDQLQQERQTLINQMTAALQERDAAVKMQNQLQANLEDLERTKKDLDAKVATTAEQLRTANFELEHWRKTHPGGGPGAPQPHQVAKVLTADNAANIVVLSLGSEDGVQVGYRYTISRGSQYVATVEVNNVQAKMSAGRVVGGPGRVMPGDDAVTSFTK